MSDERRDSARADAGLQEGFSRVFTSNGVGTILERLRKEFIDAEKGLKTAADEMREVDRYELCREMQLGFEKLNDGVEAMHVDVRTISTYINGFITSLMKRG